MYDASNQAAADSIAMSNCSRRSGGCRVVVTFNAACGAVAVGDNGGWGADRGSDSSSAQHNALVKCGNYGSNCRIVRWACSKLSVDVDRIVTDEQREEIEEQIAQQREEERDRKRRLEEERREAAAARKRAEEERKAAIRRQQEETREAARRKEQERLEAIARKKEEATRRIVEAGAKHKAETEAKQVERQRLENVLAAKQKEVEAYQRELTNHPGATSSIQVAPLATFFTRGTPPGSTPSAARATEPRRGSGLWAAIERTARANNAVLQSPVGKTVADTLAAAGEPFAKTFSPALGKIGTASDLAAAANHIRQKDYMALAEHAADTAAVEASGALGAVLVPTHPTLGRSIGKGSAQFVVTTWKVYGAPVVGDELVKRFPELFVPAQ